MKQNHRTYLVTGGAGFIGSHIVEYLLSRGDSVRVLDNFSTGRRENLEVLPEQERLQVIEGDVGNYETVLSAIEGVAGIFHQAALVSVPLSIQNPRKDFHDNTLGTFNVFEAARCTGGPPIVFASSSAVYGDNDKIPLQEEDSCNPMSPYALDKFYAEKLADVYYRNFGQTSVALRYFNVYGPRQLPTSPYSGVISIFAERLMSRKEPYIYGDGEQTRDFVYVQDVVVANIRAMEVAKKGAYLFNVGGSQSISINQLVELLQNQLGIYVKPQYLPPRQGEVRHSKAEVTRIYEHLGWQPRWEINKGLKSVLQWMSDQIP